MKYNLFSGAMKIWTDSFVRPLKYLPLVGTLFIPKIILSRKTKETDGFYVEQDRIEWKNKLFGPSKNEYYKLITTEDVVKNLPTQRKKLFVDQEEGRTYLNKITIERKTKFFLFPYIECIITDVYFNHSDSSFYSIEGARETRLTWPLINNISNGFYNKEEINGDVKGVSHELHQENAERLKVTKRQIKIGEYFEFSSDEKTNMIETLDSKKSQFREAESEIDEIKIDKIKISSFTKRKVTTKESHETTEIPDDLSRE